MLDKILSAIGKFSYRRRYLVLALTLVLFVSVAIIQSFAGISYSYADYNKVTDVFPEEDTLVLLYDNADEGKINDVINYLSENEHVTSIQAYANTLGMEMNTTALASTAGIDETFIKTLFYIKANGIQPTNKTLLTFINVVASDMFLNNPLFADKIDEQSKAQLLQSKTLLNSIAQGTTYDAQSLAMLFGMDVQSIATVFQMAGGATQMTIDGFLTTVLTLVNQFSNMVTPEQLAELTQMQSLITVIKQNTSLDAQSLATIFEMNAQTVGMIFRMSGNVTSMTVEEFLTAMLGLASQYPTMVTPEQLAGLNQMQGLIGVIKADMALDAQSLATMLEINVQTVGGIFYMAGNVQAMTLEGFVNTLLGLMNQFSNMITPEQLAGLNQMNALANVVKANQTLSPAELLLAFPVQSDMFNESTVTLIYLMIDANMTDMSNQTLALYDFFTFITESVLPNPMFSTYFDETTKSQMLVAKQTIADGKAQLVGEEHSRMIITLDYVLESQEIYDFYSALETKLDSCLEKDYYFVGTSAMSSELSKTFKTEYVTISIITAVAIFLVVCLTFKKFSLPLMLVSIIECAVFITTSVMVIGNISMYFIALIIVQCVLMGSMVDYGILFSNYYLEVREEYPVEQALPEVLKRSIRAIATSAIILITITFFCGLIMEGAVASILVTLCVGSFSALLLVVFALPSLLAIFDKAVTKNKNVL